MQPFLPARPERLAGDDLGDIVGTGVVQGGGSHRLAREGHHLGAQVFGQSHGPGDPRPNLLGCPPVVPGLDMQGGPFRPELVRQPPRRPNQPLAGGTGADAHQQPFTRRPGPGNGAGLHVGEHLLVDAPGGAPQGHLPQGGEIPLAEETLHRHSRRIGDVDLAVVQPLDQLVRRKVDQLDLRRLVQEAIGKRLSDDDAGDLGDGVVQALEVLDVERGVDIDPGLQQVVHVMVSLRVTGPRRVGVSEFVDQSQLRVARQDRVHIHFGHGRSAILHLASRDDLQPLEQSLRLSSSMGLDIPDDDVHPLRLALPRRLEHGVRLPDAGRVTEEDLELAACLLTFLGLDVDQQFVGVGS